MIENINYLNETVVKFFCKLYIMSLPLVGFSAFYYLTNDFYMPHISEKINRIAALTLAIGEFLIYISPIYIYHKGDIVYTHGLSVHCTYAVSLIFIVYNFIATLTFRKKINIDRRRGILIWMGGLSLAAIIQFFNNELLLVGYASALGLFYLFSDLENPIMYLDADSGLYNAKAIKEYINEKFSRRNPIFGFMISLNTFNKDISQSEYRRIIIEISNHLNTLKDAKVFRTDTFTFAVLIENKDVLNRIFSDVYSFFEQYSETSIPFSGMGVKYVRLNDYEIFESATDLMNTYYYLKRYKKDSEIIDINKELIDDMKKNERMKHFILKALDDDRVEVFYQPIYDIKAKKFVSAEALVRMRKENGEIVPPNEFIPIAESSGLIIQLGERIFEKVCHFISLHSMKDLGVKYIEVNLSAIQCEQKDLYYKFKEIMDEKNIDPSQINFEITETTQLNTTRALNTIDRFIEFGAKFSLDDFGTGNSNLDYVSKMPINIVKFDYTMTQNYFTNDKTKIIFEHIIPMIQELNLEIVCEGIEEEFQLKRMTEFGVDHIQGYYFSKPLPQDEYIKFLQEKNR